MSRTEWLKNVDWTKVFMLSWGAGATAYATQISIAPGNKTLAAVYAIGVALSSAITSLSNTQKPSVGAQEAPPEPPAGLTCLLYTSDAADE